MQQTFGEKFMHDRKWYYWCPHHIYPGFSYDLHVTHPPEKHNEYKERQEKMKGRGKFSDKLASGKSNVPKSGSSSDVKLVLSGSVKKALITYHVFNVLQIEQLSRALGN